MNDRLYRAGVSAYARTVTLACHLPDPLDCWTLWLANRLFCLLSGITIAECSICGREAARQGDERPLCEVHEVFRRM